MSDTVRVPRATYRVQLHRGFTFDDARLIVPYLAQLGVSHLYASPFLKARAGSTHGYDVVDHGELNPEIGSDADFAALTAALRAHGMHLMLDLVPNHMGVLNADNPWWLDVLEHGEASAYADYFDIDWRPADAALTGKVLVPILGDQYGAVLERGAIELRFAAGDGALSLWYYEHRLPIRPPGYPRVLLADVDRLPSAAAEELRRVAESFAAVPVTAGSAPRAATLGSEAKAALAALCAREPAVAQLVAANAARINGTAGDARSFDGLDALIGGQAYRVAYWRVAADDINYRRFFDINDLAALRAEREDVFAATHRRVLEIVARGDADALRIDHSDGLLDPGAYFERLQAAARSATGRPIYVVIEKILAAHERLPAAWPVHGDTGYRFMNEVNALFVDARSRARFDRVYAMFVGALLDFDAVARRSKTQVVVYSLASELNRLTTALSRIVQSDRRTRDFTANAIRRALVQVVASFPVYRTYAASAGEGEDDARHVDWAVAVAKRESVGIETAMLDFLGIVLRRKFPTSDAGVTQAILAFVQRFQQFTAPVMAKGVEDTSFYVYNRLASLNEVGGDPRIFGTTAGAFHRASATRAKHWPHALVATSTHDNKRSEDVRARIDVLSEMPAVWRLVLRRWRQLNRRHRSEIDDGPAPGANDEYLFYQTLAGAWPLAPVDAAALDAFRQRMQAYMQKAAREAKTRTSWVNVNTPYEDALARFVDGALGALDPNPFIADWLALEPRIALAGCVNSLAQAAIRLTAPGVPDTYQGTELWDDSLVDPDNRRAVDYARRAALLQGVQDADPAALLAQWRDGRVKLRLVWQLLALRRSHEEFFARAGYAGWRAKGAHAASMCAFARRRGDVEIACIVPRLWQAMVGDTPRWPLGAELWKDTRVAIPGAARAWRNVLTGEAFDAVRELPLGSVLSTFPVAVLERI
jgi:(1->4)-alpha-D-glucan 1-alpha-D-glucosylmutase